MAITKWPITLALIEQVLIGTSALGSGPGDVVPFVKPSDQ